MIIEFDDVASPPEGILLCGDKRMRYPQVMIKDDGKSIRNDIKLVFVGTITMETIENIDQERKCT